MPDLIVNGNFESGNTFGWSNVQTQNSFISTPGYNSSYSFAIGNYTNFSELFQQTINTVVGQSYSLSYVLKNPSNSNFQFDARINNNVITGSSINSSIGFNWTSKNFSFVASTTSTIVSFFAKISYSHPSYCYIDNISLMLNVPFPTITTIDPSSVYTIGGDTITINGTYFTSPATVSVGGSSVPASVSSTTQLTFVAPAKSAGNQTVIVTTSGGPSNSATLLYIPTPVPTISSIDPSSINFSGNHQVSILGTNFNYNPSVYVGDASAQILNYSSGQIVCLVPDTAVGTYKLTVYNTYGSADIDITFYNDIVNVEQFDNFLASPAQTEGTILTNIELSPDQLLISNGTKTIINGGDYIIYKTNNIG